MSDSISTKSAIVINAIAITLALSIISGYLPLNPTPLAHLQSLLYESLVNQK